MPRKPTKSPPVQFRVPLILYATLVARAELKGQTPSQFVQAMTERFLESVANPEPKP